MNTREEYSPLKILRHASIIKQFLSGESAFPVFLQIDLTNICNFNCAHCSSRMYDVYMQTRSASLELEPLKKFLLEGKVRGLKAIEITGGGEPTLYPHFVELMHFIREHFEFALVTNGSNLYKSEILEATVGATWVRVSVDSGDRNIHATIHKVKEDVFDSLLVHSMKLKEISPQTTLGFSFVVTLQNYKSITDAARVAKNFGFDNIRFSSLYTKENIPSLSYVANDVYILLDEAGKLGDSDFTVFTFRERVKDIYHMARPDKCYYSLVVGVIAANGDVFKCCALKNEVIGRIGSIYEQNYDDIFASRELINVSTCPPCWMDEKNRNMTYFISENPRHVNFP